jgi:uracil-DNA glycosylase
VQTAVVVPSRLNLRGETTEKVTRRENDDRPKLLGDSTAHAARLLQLGERHIAPLTEFVTQLRAEIEGVGDVPDFDPWDGGVDAECLFLLEAPGAKAVVSGFISRNNPDQTAKNFPELNQEAGVPRARTVTWNIVPWYIGTKTRIRAARTDDIALGLPPFQRLLQLLPRLRIVVLIGRKAERARPLIERVRPDLNILVSPHPSPLFVNNAPGNRERILVILRKVAELLAFDSPARLD